MTVSKGHLTRIPMPACRGILPESGVPYIGAHGIEPVIDTIGLLIDKNESL